MNHGQSNDTVTVTNNSNGVSADYETETPMTAGARSGGWK